MTSVKVAVRVRPYNDREKAANSNSIIRMEGGDTYITNPVSLPIIIANAWLKDNFAKQPLTMKCSSVDRRMARSRNLALTTVTGATTASSNQRRRWVTCVPSPAPSTSTKTRSLQTW